MKREIFSHYPSSNTFFEFIVCTLPPFREAGSFCFDLLQKALTKHFMEGKMFINAICLGCLKQTPQNNMMFEVKHFSHQSSKFSLN